MASNQNLPHAQAPICKCEVCNRGVDARFYCKECTQEMCKDCKTMHLRMNVSKNHTVISTAKDTDVGEKEHVQITCSIHSREQIQMFCTTCEMLVCFICLADKIHKNHDLDQLLNASEKYRKEMSQIVTETKQEITKIEALLQSIQSHIKDYKKLSDKTKSDINKHRYEIKSQVDKTADDLIEEVERRKVKEIKTMESKSEEMQQIVSENINLLRSCEDNLRSRQSGINTVIGAAKDTRQRRKKLASPLATKCTHPPVFVTGGTCDLQKTFGKLNAHTRESAYRDLYGKNQHASDENNTEKSLLNISTKLQAKIKPGVESITISCVNDNESWCGNGNDLVLISTDGKINKTVQLAKYFDDITVAETGDVLFTELEGHHVKKLSSNGKLANIAIANTMPYKTKGLCMTADNELLVCLYKGRGLDDNRIVRMSTNGEIKQIIQYNKQNKPLFDDPFYVVENYNRDVCVIDSCNSVVVVSRDGQFRYKYPDSDKSVGILTCCYGIACDKLENILLSDYKNHRVHLINRDGKLVQYVLTSEHGIEFPWGLSIDAEDKLWICNETGDEVRVYKYRS